MTPMSLAMLWNNQPMVEALLEHKDIDFNTGAPVLIPLTKACFNGYGGLVQSLIASPQTEVNLGDKTALMMASRYGQDETVEMLLAHPHIDVNKGDQKGWTALHLAAGRGHA